MDFGGKRVLWGIDVYTRVNHLRVHEELIRQTFGNSLTIAVYTGNELFDKFPDDVFHYKEDILKRVPDDPSRHFLSDGCSHGGSHNGHRDACNYFATLAGDFDYVIETPTDAVFSNYAALATMIGEMDRGQHAFLSCVSDKGHGRMTEGPRVHNEFFAVRSDFYREMYPMTGSFEGYDEAGNMLECYERGMGERVREKLDGRSWLVWPAERRGSYMALADGLTCISTENLFANTVKFMEEHAPKNLEHCRNTCLKNGLLYDIRPNYDQ